MKAVVLSRVGGAELRAEVVEVDEPRAPVGGLVIDMKASGLCGTDLEKIAGEYTASAPILGHEAVGTIGGVGDGVSGYKKGERVFPHHHVPDYTCPLCQAGNETMCDRYRRSNLDPGGFAESFSVPKWNVAGGGVLKIPSDIDFEVASMIEPLACCLRGVRKAGVKEGMSVLVAGAGPVGMMHSLLMGGMGARVLVSDVSEARLRFAEKAGVQRVLDARRDVPAAVKSETGGMGADVAMVASGSRAAILQGLRSVRKGGRVCLFGVPAKGSVLDYDFSDLYNSEQDIVTSYGASEPDTAAALAVLARDPSSYGRLVTHRFPLSRFEEAVAAARSGSAMKVVLNP